MKYLVALLAAGCAETATTCPVGTRLTVTHGVQGRAEWCRDDDATLANLPQPTRTNALQVPVGVAGGIEGPFTAWYASGAKEARGAYRNLGERSVPEGLWAFWYPSGALEVVGHYERGAPAGCFAVWDERGVRHTGVVTDATLHEQACAPPSDAELATLDGHGPETAAWADASISAFAGPARFGVANANQVAPDPDLTFAMTGAARLRLGRWRIGPSLGIRTAGAVGYLAVQGAATVAWQLPSFHPRVDTEIGAELGVERLQLTAHRAGMPGDADVAFWSALPALQASAAVALTPQLAAVAGVRVDGVPARTAVQRDTYCDGISCLPPVTETWRIGALAVGATLGLRVVLR